ncbi:MAG TPA: hypothetical protein VFP68_08585 [Burkholderiaceae bacterium]|nr:hypothetical protein [Burkholderiaceae bacterium]
MLTIVLFVTGAGAGATVRFPKAKLTPEVSSPSAAEDESACPPPHPAVPPNASAHTVANIVQRVTTRLFMRSLDPLFKLPMSLLAPVVVSEDYSPLLVCELRRKGETVVAVESFMK